MSDAGGRIILRAKGAVAEIAPLGAEPVSWRVGGHELLWQRDPAWWDMTAPILFPVVGASRGGTVVVAGCPYSMPLHGFARSRLFRLMEKRAESARLRFESDCESRRHFPFDFDFDVTVSLFGKALQLSFDVTNRGRKIMPYALGFHPGFQWSGGRGRLEFETEEDGRIPCIAAQGLLARQCRVVPIQGCILPLSADSFSNGALVFRNTRSQGMTLIGEHGAIRLRAEGFRHFAVWSKPSAPFLCLETLTAHADWEDFGGEFAQRDDMIMLQPGQSRHHSIRLDFLSQTTLEKLSRNQI